MDKSVFTESKFSKGELKLIKLLEKREMTKKEITDAGLPFSTEFLDRCCNNGVKIYESDDHGAKKVYGILA